MFIIASGTRFLFVHLLHWFVVSVDFILYILIGLPLTRDKFMTTCRTTNIVDNMIRMMERYTDQLEDIVDERTKQLAIEKAKTDELLYKMLPK